MSEAKHSPLLELANRVRMTPAYSSIELGCYLQRCDQPTGSGSYDDQERVFLIDEKSRSAIEAALLATSLHHELVAALDGIVKHMDSNGMQDWPAAKKARAALQKAKQGDKP